jgi:hypothetical protein
LEVEDERIPYEEMADRLFGHPGDQLIVPFLGAGASLPPPSQSPAPKLPADCPKRADIDQMAAQIGLHGIGADFFRIAVVLAFLIRDAGAVKPPSMLQALSNAVHPPSVWQLSRLFSELARYSSLDSVAGPLGRVVPEAYASNGQIVESLRAFAKLTGIAYPPDPLTSISNLYEAQSERASVWGHLQKLIGNKRATTGIHSLLAESAERHLSAKKALDYLIVTTNYDTLMEQALDAKGIPYVVLLTRKEDQRVVARFSEGVDSDGRLARDHEEQYPQMFVLSKPMSLVVIHKLHGCASPALSPKDDGIVISDSDYVGFISQMNRSEGVIPAAVRRLMKDRPFLFLGYSLADWNVRSVFEMMRAQRTNRNRIVDFSVMLSVREYDRIFFEKNNVTIYKTDLARFAQRVRDCLTPESPPGS